jgi:GNAT superfamily N-acetyltransferase
MTNGLVEDISVARDARVTPEEFQRVLVSSGLGTIHPVDNLERLERMLEGANLIVTARDRTRDNALIGIARAVTDFSWCCYLSDIAVVREAQASGVGRRLIERMRDLLGPEVALVLAAVPEAAAFYERIGMEPMPDCFRFRRRV